MRCLSHPLHGFVLLVALATIGPSVAASAAGMSQAQEAATGPASGAKAGSPELEALLSAADRWLLDGETTPDDFQARLQTLAPPERLLALAYARRLGIYDGPVLSTGFLLEPLSEDAPR